MNAERIIMYVSLFYLREPVHQKKNKSFFLIYITNNTYTYIHINKTHEIAYPPFHFRISESIADVLYYFTITILLLKRASQAHRHMHAYTARLLE